MKHDAAINEACGFTANWRDDAAPRPGGQLAWLVSMFAGRMRTPWVFGRARTYAFTIQSINHSLYT